MNVSLKLALSIFFLIRNPTENLKKEIRENLLIYLETLSTYYVKGQLIQKATEHFRNVIAYCVNKKFKRKITNYYIILDSIQQIFENNNHATVDQTRFSRDHYMFPRQVVV